MQICGPAPRLTALEKKARRRRASRNLGRTDVCLLHRLADLLLDYRALCHCVLRRGGARSKHRLDIAAPHVDDCAIWIRPKGSAMVIPSDVAASSASRGHRRRVAVLQANVARAVRVAQEAGPAWRVEIDGNRASRQQRLLRLERNGISNGGHAAPPSASPDSRSLSSSEGHMGRPHRAWPQNAPTGRLRHA
jgi:hypothetical protein